MTDRQTTGEHGFRSDPFAVIEEHLSSVDSPGSETIAHAAELIRASYPARDALGISMDLNTKVSNPTTVMAEMFNTGHDALPAHWRANPEITRAVLLMSGQIEAGILRAQQVSQAHEGGNPQVGSRLAEVEYLVASLEQK